MVNIINVLCLLCRFVKNDVMKKTILISFFLMFTMSIYAQFDKKSKPLKLELKLKTADDMPTDFSTDLPSINFKSSLDKKDDSFLKKYSILNKKEPVKSVLEQKNDFKNPGDEIKDKLNKEIAKEGNWEDVFFGKYVVNTPNIKIMAKDFADPDGDRVQMVLNGITIELSILLESYYKTYIVDLEEGDNLIDIIALNQGLAGPNTASFSIYDGNGRLITSNEWNLNTGVAAKFSIEYVKPISNSK